MGTLGLNVSFQLQIGLSRTRFQVRKIAFDIFSNAVYNALRLKSRARLPLVDIKLSCLEQGERKTQQTSNADVAQLVEQAICNRPVLGPSPSVGSSKN